MALEDKLKEIFPYEIDSARPYDSDYFVSEVDRLFNLRDYLLKFKNDPSNPSTHYRLGLILHPSNPEFYDKFTDSETIIVVEGNAAYESLVDAMARYVQEHVENRLKEEPENVQKRYEKLKKILPKENNKYQNQ